MKKHFELAPLVLLIAFTTKLMIQNSWSYQEAIVLLGLAAISGLFHLKHKNDEMAALEARLENQARDIEFLKSQNEAVKNTISGMKLASAAKTMPRF